MSKGAVREKIEKARLLYLDGKKLKDIAAEMGVPDGTVRRWKHDYNWCGNDNKKEAVQKKKNEQKNEQIPQNGIKFSDLTRDEVMDRIAAIGFRPAFMDNMGTSQINAMLRSLIYLADNMQPDDENEEEQCVIQMIDAVPEGDDE